MSAHTGVGRQRSPRSYSTRRDRPTPKREQKRIEERRKAVARAARMGVIL